MTTTRLLADIGGTNARFALQIDGRFHAVAVLACADYPTLNAAIDACLAQAATQGVDTRDIRHAAIAIAYPVDDDLVRMTNHHWRFSVARLRADRQFMTLLVVNDFAALAMALPALAPSQREEVLGAAAITGRALGSKDGACLHTIATFCGILGSVAGNVALTLGATGGMYIGRGIVPRLGKLFAQSTFRQRFEDKGRLAPYLARIPTWLITEPYPALFGVAALLSARVDGA